LNTNELIVSVGSAFTAILIAVIAFFAQKWIASVDETIKEHSSDLKDVSKQISTLEQKQSSQAENIAERIQTQLTALRLPSGQVERIEEKVSRIENDLSKKILPEITKASENMGRVFVLENSMQSMFKVLKVLVDRQKQKDQK
jgi:uncharacterized protein YoxC